jgi:low temperature requirement protein LtrA
VFIFLAGLALPHAFGADSTLFVVAYAVVRFLHLWLYADASRKGNASWRAISGFAVTVVIGMLLFPAGSFLHGAARAALWAAALAIDYGGPAWLTRDRLRGLQRVAVSHFAERYSLFVIICLGESIVAVAVGTRGRVKANGDVDRGDVAQPADHGRDVVDVLRQLRRHRRGSPARGRRSGAEGR